MFMYEVEFTTHSHTHTLEICLMHKTLEYIEYGMFCCCRCYCYCCMFYPRYGYIHRAMAKPSIDDLTALAFVDVFFRQSTVRRESIQCTNFVIISINLSHLYDFRFSI